MKILMIGRGAVASVYGWALARAGHEVELYVRPGRAAAYGPTVDLDLLDARRRPWGQRVVDSWPVRLREDLPPDHDVDLVVLSVAHHRLAEAAAFLGPRVGNATVLVLGNVWSEPLAAVADLPVEQVAWGFPQAGGAFGEDGVLRGVLMGSVVVGTVGRPAGRADQVVRRAFGEAGFRFREQADLRGWLWIHVAADAGVHSQGLRLGSLSRLIGARAALREALLVTRELLPLVEARGVDLRRHRRSVRMFRAPTWLTAPVLAWTLVHVPLARASMAAHRDPDTEEPRAICRDTLAEARRLGVPVPRLEALEATFSASGTAVPTTDRPAR